MQISSKTALLATGATALALFASPALAQEARDTDGGVTCADLDNDGQCDEVAPVPTGASTSSAADGEIVVVGSRIRRDNFDTPTQVNIVTRDDVILSGAASTADVLQSSSITSGTSQINGAFLGFLSEGGTGASTVGLRGFGAARTLTLLNGRRLAPAGVGPELVAADLNVLPSAIVQRYEILRNGASSIYGSDAIAGVINVITDTRVDGVTLDLYTNQPIDHGGGGRTYRGSLTAGQTFDRGYLTGSVEYRERTALKLYERDIFDCPRYLYRDPTTGEEVGPRGPDGQFQCFPYTAGSQGTASGYGIFQNFNATTAANAFGRVTFDEDGNTQRVDGLYRVGPNPIQREPDILLPVKTYTAFLSGAYEMDGLGQAELYGEGLFTRRKSSYSSTRQLSINTAELDPGIEVFNGVYNYPLDDGSFIPIPLEVFGYGISPFFPVALDNIGANYFAPFIQPNRLFTSEQEVDFLRANGGLRGALGFSDWRYDANLQYSRTKGKTRQPQVTIDRFNNALITALAPAGTPENLITTAPNYAVQAGNRYTCASNLDDSGNFIAGSTCVPINLYELGTFSNGAIPDNQFNYLYQDDLGETKFRQITASFIIDGTLFEGPGGPIRAALGYEHREDKIVDTPSLDRQNARLYNFSSAGITRGKDNLDEVFGEINVPLISDRPFAQLLEFTASGRYSDYKSFGSDFVYSLTGQYQPTDFLRFRANYGTSFRAPNLFEQYVADQVGFFGSGVDPCSGFGAAFSPGDPLYDNCLSELAPILGTAGALNFVSTAGPSVTTKGGIGDLNAETSKNYGFGGILTVDQGPIDFSLAVDYWNIKVNDSITTLGSLILPLCYESDDFPNNRFCDLINPRLPASDNQRGNLDSFDNPYINVATQKADGIDFDSRLGFDVGGGEVILRGRATRNLSQVYQRFEDSEPFDYNGTLGTQGFGAGPKWVGDFNARYIFPSGNFELRYGFDYVGPQDSSIFGTDEVAAFIGPVDVDLKVGSYFEHGASARWKVGDLGQFTLGMNNIFNAKPPIISACPSSGCDYTRIGNRFNSSNYDLLGRTIFLNVTRTFD